MKRYILSIFLFLFCNAIIYGQTIVKGVVLDEFGVELPGASITLKNTTVGTITNAKGEFQFNFPEIKEGTLVFTFIGFDTQEVEFKGNMELKITLVESSTHLEEVVVTALGISREARSLGYARQAVDVESMTEARSANMLNMLEGKAAGVNIISTGGPTASTRVEIRGNTSLTGNNQPLYVIDGVIIQNDMGKNETGYFGAQGTSDIDYGNVAANINPDDIESIEILKGGNAAALYGSDAANGVILITTKKAGKHQNIGLSFNSNMMFSTITEYPEFQNIYGGGNSHRLGETNKYRYMSEPNLALLSPYNARSWGLPMLGFPVVGRNGEIKSYSPNPDNVRDYFSSSYQLTNNFSVSKSNDVSSFRFSYSNTIANDVLEGANLRNRHNFSLRSDYNLTNYLKIEGNVRYSIDKLKNRSYSGWSVRNPLMAYLFFPRDLSIDELIPWKDDNGNAIRLSSENVSEYYNPYWAINENKNEDEKNWFLADVTVNADITKNIKLRIKTAADIQNTLGFDFTNKGTIGKENGSYSTFYRNVKNYQHEALLSYYQRFNLFSLNAYLGASWRDNYLYKNTSYTSSLILHDVASLSNSAEPVQTFESLERIRRESIYGAATLGYKDWLFIDATVRNDWNSTLPIKNCSFFYPSISTSVIFSEVLDIPQNILTLGKLRGSWAKVGNGTSFNQLYNNYSYSGIFNTIPTFELGSRLKSSVLKPETTFTTELGVDLKLFNNRAAFDATYYYMKSVDQIMNPRISPSTGYVEGTFNSGEIQNRGIELTLNVTPVKTNNFDWDVTMNWSKNNSKVVSIMDSLKVYTLMEVSSNLRITVEENEPYGILRGSRQMRDEDGNLMVDEANNRAIVESDAYLGRISPDFMGSVKSSFKYKRVNLSVLMDYKVGGKLFSRSSLHGVREGNWLRTLANRDDYTFSYSVLNESNEERYGVNKDDPYIPYTDTDRIKGARFEGILYKFNEETGTYTKMGPNMAFIQPQQYWQHAGNYLMDWFIYDASFVKLREISFSYNMPSSLLKNLPLKSVTIALVGRDLLTIYKNTPKGIDPQATVSSGNAQGIESGFTLPTAYYGFDLKVSF